MKRSLIAVDARIREGTKLRPKVDIVKKRAFSQSWQDATNIPVKLQFRPWITRFEESKEVMPCRMFAGSLLSSQAPEEGRTAVWAASGIGAIVLGVAASSSAIFGGLGEFIPSAVDASEFWGAASKRSFSISKVDVLWGTISGLSGNSYSETLGVEIFVSGNGSNVGEEFTEFDSENPQDGQ